MKRPISLTQGFSAAISLRLLAAVFSLLLLLGQAQLSATVIFSDNFNYTIGSSLTGKNGGSGFGGAWTGGSTTYTSAPLAGSGGNSVGISTSDYAYRNLSSSYTITNGTTCYVAFLCNLASSPADGWIGVSLYSSGAEKVFFGIPLSTNTLGFDYPRVSMVTPAFALNTTYLAVYSLTGNTNTGTQIKMWVTTNLGVDPTTLISGAPNASGITERSMTEFDQVRLAGGYPTSGDFKIQGLNAATTVTEAVGFAVPEPSTYALLGMGALAVVLVGRRRECQLALAVKD